MYTQLIPWTHLNHSQLSLCNNSEKLLKLIRDFPLNIWADSATGMIFQLQLKTKGESAERPSRKDWNGIEKRMAHRAPTVELWRLHGAAEHFVRLCQRGNKTNFYDGIIF